MKERKSMIGPLLVLFGSSFILAFSGAMMPGPLFAVTVAESPRQGYKTGPLLMLGHGILEMALIAALLFGLAPFLSDPKTFTAVSSIGGTILLAMSILMLKTLPSLDLPAPGTARKSNSLVWSGILVSLSNPYWLLWWATVGLGCLGRSRPYGLKGIIVFFSGHILADFVWYGMVSAAVCRGRRILKKTAYRILTGVCACFLALFGVYFLGSAIVKML